MNKLDGVNYKIGKTKAPVILDNTVSYLEARVIDEKDVGDHTLFIAEVVDANIVSEKPCMTYDYYHQTKRGAMPKASPSYISRGEATKLAKYECTVCGWIYDPEIGDPEGGIKPGIPFEDLPDTWVCPICGVGKDLFKKI